MSCPSLPYIYAQWGLRSSFSIIPCTASMSYILSFGNLVSSIYTASHYYRKSTIELRRLRMYRLLLLILLLVNQSTGQQTTANPLNDFVGTAASAGSVVSATIAVTTSSDSPAFVYSMSIRSIAHSLETSRPTPSANSISQQILIHQPAVVVILLGPQLPQPRGEILGMHLLSPQHTGLT